MRVDLPLYVRGFTDASARFSDPHPDWEPAFRAIFEAVMWAASIRDHLRARGSGYLNECPHLEGLYFVRNLVGHVLPEIGGGEPPYLTDVISSHGASLATSIARSYNTWTRAPEPTTWLSWLGDTPEWRWLPRSEWSGTPQSPKGGPEYDRHLDGELVASTLGTVGAYLDGL